MKSSYPRLRRMWPSRLNPIFMRETIRDVGCHNGAVDWESVTSDRGELVRYRYPGEPPVRRITPTRFDLDAALRRLGLAA